MTRAILLTLFRSVEAVLAIYGGVALVADGGLNPFERAMPYGTGSISLRSTEPLRVSSAVAVTIPIAEAGK